MSKNQRNSFHARHGYVAAQYATSLSVFWRFCRVPLVIKHGKRTYPMYPGFPIKTSTDRWFWSHVWGHIFARGNGDLVQVAERCGRKHRQHLCVGTGLRGSGRPRATAGARDGMVPRGVHGFVSKMSLYPKSVGESSVLEIEYVFLINSHQ